MIIKKIAKPGGLTWNWSPLVSTYFPLQERLRQLDYCALHGEAVSSILIPVYPLFEIVIENRNGGSDSVQKPETSQSNLIPFLQMQPAVDKTHRYLLKRWNCQFPHFYEILIEL